MSASQRAVNWFLRRVFQTVCRIDVDAFKQVPRSGPYILVGNHINFLEVPVIVAHLDNPDFTGLAKKETWNNPLFHFLFNQWELIPIHRDMIDRQAFDQATQVLSRGKILAISPEGTRSKHGRLLQGKPGVVALAVRSQAPLLPIGLYGYENFWYNLKRLRRTEFHMAVGKPFRLQLNGVALSREVRQAVTDEIMYRIAELLPHRNRGHYHFEGEVNYRYTCPN
ncbi:MAG TPA: lysophospholipid acyltransferase family protein [Anaerolinea sp.]|nr:lysophospholipid acyltransferase family protein [Anaerolinea sp.]